MKKRKFLLVILTLILSLSSGLWGLVISAQSGNWNDPYTWDGNQIPTSTDNVRILAGHSVVLNQPATIVDLQLDGTLTFQGQGSGDDGIYSGNDLIWGDLTVNGTRTLATDSNVIYDLKYRITFDNTNIEYIIPADNYYNLTIQPNSNGSYNVACLYDDTYIMGTLTINSNAILNTEAFIINGPGRIVFADYATLNVRHAEGVDGIASAVGMNRTLGTSVYSSLMNIIFSGPTTGVFTTTPTANTVHDASFYYQGNFTLNQDLNITGTGHFGIDYQTYMILLGDNDFSCTGTVSGSPSFAINGSGMVLGNLIPRITTFYYYSENPAYIPSFAYYLDLSSNLYLPNNLTLQNLNFLGFSLYLNSHTLIKNQTDLALSGSAGISRFDVNFVYNDEEMEVPVEINGISSIPRQWQTRISGSGSYNLILTYDASYTENLVNVWASVNNSTWIKLNNADYTAVLDGSLRTVTVPMSFSKAEQDKATTIQYTVTNAEVTLPVELSAFTGVYSSTNGITLNWTTQSESNVLGYNIYRNTEKDLTNAPRVNFSLITGTNTSQEHIYSYSDMDLTSPEYYYWLENVQNDGSTHFYGPVKVLVTNTPSTDPVIPLVTTLKSVYPNPFNPSTSINYDLSKPAQVNIYIYNVKGQIVKTLFKGNNSAGQFKVVWNGRDNNDKTCGSGVYYIKMDTGDFTSLKKVMMIK